MKDKQGARKEKKGIKRGWGEKRTKEEKEEEENKEEERRLERGRSSKPRKK